MRHRLGRLRLLLLEKGGQIVMEDFYKLCVVLFSDVLVNLPGNPCKVLGYILRHMNGNNRLVLTYTQVAKTLECSPDTVGAIVRRLCQDNFMKRITGSNIYMINPSVLMKGREGRFRTLKERYDAI